MGCGTGGQMMVIANHKSGNITAIDLSPIFIDIFNINSQKLSLQNRVNGIVALMNNFPFQNEELNLIWSEIAIYNIGFERGINE
ncbi:MAG: class I SAM-dependent methyltransferase [Trichodesmium sp. St11_bin5]|nr:class I SAM-dependent methyltransferase [Trichodesmium sp. St11_bin5]